MKKLFFIPLLFAHGLCFGQNLEDILHQSKEALSTQEYAMDILYTQKFQGENGLETTTSRSTYKRFDTGYFQSIDDLIIQVQENGVLLTVDKDEEVISLDHSTEESNISSGMDLDMFDNEFFDTQLDSKGDVHKVTVTAKGEYASLKSVEVHYSKTTFYPKKIVIQYPVDELATGQVISLTIDYKTSEVEGRSPSDSIQHFVKRKEDDFDILSPDYENFDKLYHLWN